MGPALGASVRGLSNPDGPGNVKERSVTYNMSATDSYFKEVRSARTQKTKANKELTTAHDAVYTASATSVERDKLNRQRLALEGAISQRHNARVQLAFAQLAFSEEPVVAWMAQNCGSYRDHVDLTFQHLIKNPDATITDLKKLASSNNWCETFQGYLNQACAAGVVDDGRSPEQRALEEYFFGFAHRNTDRDRHANLAQALVDATKAEAERVFEAGLAARVEEEIAKRDAALEEAALNWNDDDAEPAPAVIPPAATEPAPAEPVAEPAADRELVAA